MRRSRILVLVPVLLLIAGFSSAPAQQLFAGLEDATLPTRSTNLAGFPNVAWSDHFAFEVNGAAATPDGQLFLCNGAFTTHLYRSTLNGPPEHITTTSVDLHGLGYGNGTLYGFSNFASPMGIYEVNTTTGLAVLAVNTSTQGYRFFGLDFNAVDGLLYGYTEYGVTGLYSIDPASGVMSRIVAPGVNGQGRALAVGGNTVYLLATRGDEGEPCFAYNLAQGSGGTWTPFTNPYPQHHSTGGAAWIPPAAGVEDDAPEGWNRLRLDPPQPNPLTRGGHLAFVLSRPGPVRAEIFDAAGHLVARPIDGRLGSGPQTIRWNGSGMSGDPVPAGIYLVRLSAAGESQSRKWVVIR